ncbi:hypothetical protein EVAR_13718_1 [Eumeta japonica]|uniref:Uncharacterized protein n=1 Tax=Eumeta variegata TaxID=151549 RepID=A0A4C1UBH2_EUMVA|nr:hypothetical protein EVAR_13718_1 [Eumeta japonica]
MRAQYHHSLTLHSCLVYAYSIATYSLSPQKKEKRLLTSANRQIRVTCSYDSDNINVSQKQSPNQKLMPAPVDEKRCRRIDGDGSSQFDWFKIDPSDESFFEGRIWELQKIL